MEDLLGILALESHRQRCLVVGEDLGTVPEGFRERMTAANILSYRVLFFEQDRGRRIPSAEAYPPLALAVVGSHDLPTLRGWWQSRDIELKERLGLYPEPGEAARQRHARERDEGERCWRRCARPDCCPIRVYPTSRSSPARRTRFWRATPAHAGDGADRRPYR